MWRENVFLSTSALIFSAFAVPRYGVPLVPHYQQPPYNQYYPAQYPRPYAAPYPPVYPYTPAGQQFQNRQPQYAQPQNIANPQFPVGYTANSQQSLYGGDVPFGLGGGDPYGTRIAESAFKVPKGESFNPGVCTVDEKQQIIDVWKDSMNAAISIFENI